MYGGKDIPGRAENGAKIKERKHDDDYEVCFHFPPIPDRCLCQAVWRHFIVDKHKET